MQQNILDKLLASLHNHYNNIWLVFWHDAQPDTPYKPSFFRLSLENDLKQHFFLELRKWHHQLQEVLLLIQV